MATHVDASVSLENGDHLTREEFHRRYLARPDINRAQLVEGVVYVGGRVRMYEHGVPHAQMVAWLGMYSVHDRSIHCYDAISLILDDRNEVQPDAVICRPQHGMARVNEECLLEGPPQLIVEVAASRVSYELHQKKEAYRRNGVPEYIVWRVVDRAIDWFRLIDGEYVLVAPGADGIVESEQFPGLRLHVPSMLARDLPALLAHMSRGSEI